MTVLGKPSAAKPHSEPFILFHQVGNANSTGMETAALPKLPPPFPSAVLGWRTEPRIDLQTLCCGANHTPA